MNFSPDVESILDTAVLSSVSSGFTVVDAETVLRMRRLFIEEAVRLWAKQQKQVEADRRARSEVGMRRGTSTPSFP